MELRESLSSNPITFRNRNDFMIWYSDPDNSVYVNSLSTKGVNNKIKINGYKLGRRDGKLVMYPTKSAPEPVIEETKPPKRKVSQSKKSSKPSKPVKSAKPVKKSAKKSKYYEEPEESSEESSEYEEDYSTSEEETESSEEEVEYVPRKKITKVNNPPKKQRNGPSTHEKLNSLNQRTKLLEKFAEEFISKWNEEEASAKNQSKTQPKPQKQEPIEPNEEEKNNDEVSESFSTTESNSNEESEE